MTALLPLAVQLYTFHDPDADGPAPSTLDRGLPGKLASLGFAGVETVDVSGGDTGAAVQALAAAGISVTSVHTRAQPDDPAAFDRACGEAAALGAPRIVVQGTAFGSLAELAAFPRRLEAAARIAERHGLRLALHNHRRRDARRARCRPGLRAPA